MLFIKTRVVFGIFLSIMAFSLKAQSETCQQIQAEYAQRLNSLFNKYEQIEADFKFGEENEPELFCGSNKEAVYILHGFIGTPEEMSRVAQGLKRRGYTVLNDLIPGHGSSAKIANSFSEVYWQGYVTKNISLLRKVYKKIHFIGFSTGALLIHNYLYENRTNLNPESVVFYSPFYKPAKPFIDMLNVSLNNFIEVISVQKIYHLTRFREIEVALLKPENYQSHLPLLAAEEVTNLGEKTSLKLQKNIRKKIAGPVLAFLSTSDGLAKYEDSKFFIEKSFLHADFVVYDSQKVPHHLMVHEVSPVADEVYHSSLSFIASKLKKQEAK